MNKPLDSLNVAVHPVVEPAVTVLTLPFSCNTGKYCNSILCYKLLLWNYYLSLGGYFIIINDCYHNTLALFCFGTLIFQRSYRVKFSL